MFEYNLGGVLDHFDVFKQLILKLQRIKFNRVLYQLYVAYLKHEIQGFLKLLVRASNSKGTILSLTFNR